MARLLKASDFPTEKWADWRWHTANAIRTVEELSSWINVTREEASAIAASANRYRWRVTPHYASLMSPDDPCCPIRAQAIPHHDELLSYAGAEVDPVGDRAYRVTNRIIHKYPDRAVLLVTQNCPVYCRFCTRKYHTTHKNGSYFESGENRTYTDDFAYLRAHPQIRDVLLTGGDPLIYADDKIEALLRELRTIGHIEIIRIGSRYPVLLPQRVTADLCRKIEAYNPIWFSTHFNHPRELTPESAEACARLLRHGIPIQNQTVLLKGINDNIQTMRSLMTGLLKVGVKPYYLYHCDNVVGASHFMTSIAEGRRIMAGLVGHISGYALPRYIMTTRLGKISLERSFVHEMGQSITLENYRGELLHLDSELDDTPRPLG